MRVMIDISYDGSEFEGFASQPHGKTVEDTITNAITRVYKKKLKIYGTSRTDSNVSAYTQYIVFDAPFHIEESNIPKAINSNIPASIYCKSAKYVAAKYMPRYNVKYKTYIYTITNKYDPTLRNIEHFIKSKLNINEMKLASNCLIGTHDFSAFCSANTDVQDKVRTIYDISINERNDRISIEVSGDGFLYNMVRIIVGCLIVIGLGKEKAPVLENILKSKDRSLAFATAPANGLVLQKIMLKDMNE